MDLFEKYRHLIPQISSKLDIAREHREEAHQAGYLALLEALKSYNITKGIKIEVIASESILNVMRPFVHNTHPTVYCQPVDIRLTPEMANCVEYLLVHLTPTERHVVRCYFGIKYEQKTLQELAWIYDTDVEEIEEIKEAALGHLRLSFFS